MGREDINLLPDGITFGSFRETPLYASLSCLGCRRRGLAQTGGGCRLMQRPGRSTHPVHPEMAPAVCLVSCHGQWVGRGTASAFQPLWHSTPEFSSSTQYTHPSTHYVLHSRWAAFMFISITWAFSPLPPPHPPSNSNFLTTHLSYEIMNRSKDVLKSCLMTEVMKFLLCSRHYVKH